jgi:hypothetical protein
MSAARSGRRLAEGCGHEGVPAGGEASGFLNALAKGIASKTLKRPEGRAPEAAGYAVLRGRRIQIRDFTRLVKRFYATGKMASSRVKSGKVG